MATYPLSYVVLPEGLGGRTVTAERARRHVDGRELRPSEIVYVIHDADLEGRHWTLWLHSERELPEVCPAEPADTTAWLGNDGVVYERVDSRGVTRSGLEPRAHSHGAYRWWASDLGGPMRWPNVWHRCQGGLRRLSVADGVIEVVEVPEPTASLEERLQVSQPGDTKPSPE